MAIKTKLYKDSFKKIIKSITAPISFIGNLASDKYDVIYDEVLPDELAKESTSLSAKAKNYVPGEGFKQNAQEQSKVRTNTSPRATHVQNQSKEKNNASSRATRSTPKQEQARVSSRKATTTRVQKEQPLKGQKSKDSDNELSL